MKSVCSVLKRFLLFPRVMLSIEFFLIFFSGYCNSFSYQFLFTIFFNLYFIYFLSVSNGIE